MRKFGFQVSIVDANAENLDKEMVYNRLIQLNPKLICFVVYGQNVNAGTSNMEGATSLSNYIKEKNNNFIISYIGSYVQALPKKALEDEKSIDFVFTNEGVYALKNILTLKSFDKNKLKNIKGIAYRDGKEAKINSKYTTYLKIRIFSSSEILRCFVFSDDNYGIQISLFILNNNF